MRARYRGEVEFRVELVGGGPDRNLPESFRVEDELEKAVLTVFRRFGEVIGGGAIADFYRADVPDEVVGNWEDPHLGQGSDA